MKMKRPAKILLWMVAIVLIIAGSLILIDPYIPNDVAFGTEDLEARSYYESLVKKHGFDYHYEKDVHGETLVVISGIRGIDSKKIYCEFTKWDDKRSRAEGIIVYENKECKGL